MKIHAITSPSNPLLKQIRGLHQRHWREKSGLFLVEGQKAVSEAFDKRLHVEQVVVSNSYLEQQPDVLANGVVRTANVVDDKLFKELATTTTPDGVLAVARVPRYGLDDLFKRRTAPLIVVAHAVQDPGNLGTIVRTSLAASANGIITTKGTVDAFNPKVVRAAMGALFALPVVADLAYPQAVEELKRRGVSVLACHMDAPRFYFEADLRRPTAIVLGNEGQGFTAQELSLADELIKVPMNPQSESLNVAVCGAVVLFSAVQQRMSASS